MLSNEQQRFENSIVVTYGWYVNISDDENSGMTGLRMTVSNMAQSFCSKLTLTFQITSSKTLSLSSEICVQNRFIRARPKKVFNFELEDGLWRT